MIKNNSSDSGLVEEAFFTFYDPICRTAMRILNNPEEAKDVTSDCFRKLIEREGPPLKTTNEIKAFLTVVARNACIDILRKRNNRIWIGNPNAERYTFDQMWEVEFTITLWGQEIRNEIDKQPKQRRKILILHFYENKTRLEISQLLNISPNTVDNVLIIGKNLLRQKFGHLDIWK